MTAQEFISSMDNKLYNKIRKSKGDAECRKHLKEHLSKQLVLTDNTKTCEKGCDYKYVSVSWWQCKFCKSIKTD